MKSSLPGSRSGIVGPKTNQKKHRTNNEIRVNEVRLIDNDGSQLGVVSRSHAISLAEQRNLDLVEIAPQAKPPVCKIIDYGKFIYDLQKKDKVQKKNQQQQQLKEIRFKSRTDTHDFDFKTRHAREFLEEGNKVKGTVFFRGREITHKDIGQELLQRFVDALEDVSKIDSPIKSEGRNISVILAPDKIKKKTK